MQSSIRHLSVNSPVGILKISGDDEAITALDFQEAIPAEEYDASNVMKDFAQQLEEYFTGKRTAFSIPFKLEGTDFQKRIWQQVYDIPFGKTVSYLDLSIAAGDRNLIRAVGGANGANKLPILIPCHRVIGTNGKLTGYAGGLWRKKWLLDFEMRKEQPELFWEESSVISRQTTAISYKLTTND